MPLRLSKALSLGIVLCVLLLLLVSWELAFLNKFVTAFLRLGIFPVWRLLVTKNLLSILLVTHGCLNNFFPRCIQGIPFIFVPKLAQHFAKIVYGQ
jgi:hypothetical protein